MWSLEIIELAPGIKASLALLQAQSDAILTDLGFKGTMKALVLAQGLRMKGPSMNDANILADQPHRQRSEDVMLV